jgi:hypothetical protein
LWGRCPDFPGLTQTLLAPLPLPVARAVTLRNESETEMTLRSVTMSGLGFLGQSIHIEIEM